MEQGINKRKDQKDQPALQQLFFVLFHKCNRVSNADHWMKVVRLWENTKWDGKENEYRVTYDLPLDCVGLANWKMSLVRMTLVFIANFVIIFACRLTARHFFDSPKLTEKIWRWATEPLFFIYHDCNTVLKLPFESTSECQERQTRPHYLENPLTNNFRNLSSLKKLLRHKYTIFLTEDSISFRKYLCSPQNGY